jgi:tetratricopeptide (TPR) repeat protein
MSVLNVIVRVFMVILLLAGILLLNFLGYDVGFEVLIAGGVIILIIDYGYTILVFRRYFLILYNRCDPVKFIRKIRRRINGSVSNSVRYMNLLRVFLGLGLFYSGALEEMRLVLDEVAAKPKMPRKVEVLFIQLQICSAMQSEDYRSAQMHINGLENLMTVCKRNKRLALQLQSNIDYYQFLLRLKQGDYTDAEDKLNKQLDMAVSKLSRVAINYLLADVYRNSGDKNKELSALEYVVQNGNGLDIVTKAKQRLMDLVNAA